MATTPRTKTVNEAQKVLKSIEPQEEIRINISKKVTGSELENALSGIAAFTKVFDMNDKYMLEVKVSKLIEDVNKDDKDKQQSNEKNICNG